jgi:hypothetical protein
MTKWPNDAIEGVKVHKVIPRPTARLLPLRCHQHFGLLVSHLGSIFRGVVVDLVTISIC